MIVQPCRPVQCCGSDPRSPFCQLTKDHKALLCGRFTPQSISVTQHISQSVSYKKQMLLLPVCMAQLLKSVASRSILQPCRAACFQGIWKICADCWIKCNKMIHALFFVHFPKWNLLAPSCVCACEGEMEGPNLVQPADSWIPPRLNLLLQPRPEPQPAWLLHAAVQSFRWAGRC